jgi:hypothetical protein
MTMPLSYEHIREHANITETKQDAGVMMTLDLRVYDNGLMCLNGTPVGTQTKGQRGEGRLPNAGFRSGKSALP